MNKDVLDSLTGASPQIKTEVLKRMSLGQLQLLSKLNELDPAQVKKINKGEASFSTGEIYSAVALASSGVTKLFSDTADPAVGIRNTKNAKAPFTMMAERIVVGFDSAASGLDEAASAYATLFDDGLDAALLNAEYTITVNGKTIIHKVTGNVLFGHGGAAMLNSVNGESGFKLETPVLIKEGDVIAGEITLPSGDSLSATQNYIRTAFLGTRLL